MSTVPQQQKALILETKGGALTVKPSPVPAPRVGEVLVRLEAVALNPIDALVSYMIEKFPAIIGVDGAGVVVALGEGVEGVGVGDRVAVQGSFNMIEKSINGTFAQYVATPAKFIFKIPESTTLTAAATMPCTLPTSALVLYSRDMTVSSPRLVAPWAPGGRGKYAGTPALVLGGSSSVGQYALQFLRLSGFSPLVATASPQHTARLTALGATHVLDRNLPPAELQEQAAALATGREGFALVFDAVSLSETASLARALAAPGADVVFVSPAVVGQESEGAKAGVKVHLARGLLSIPSNEVVGRELLDALAGLLESGDIQTMRAEVLEGGLAGIPAGLERIQAKQVSGMKLVALPQETA